MEIVISKAFVEKFYDYYKTDDVYWEDFEHFLKKSISPNTTLITDVPETEWFSFGLSYKWFTQLQERLRKTIFVANLITRITEIDYYKKEASPFLLFCIDKDNNDCIKLEKKFGYMYLNLTHLHKSWEIFYTQKEHEYHLKITKDENVPDMRRFDSWNKLTLFKHPISHVIIFDKYILGNKTNQKMEKNIFPLLEALFCSISQQKRTIFITIVIESENQTTLSNSQTQVMAFLKRKWSHIDFDVSLFAYRSDVKVNNQEGLHDRRIYTNYFRISSGASFNYFSDKGNINEDTEIHVDFVFGKNNSFIMKDLRDIKAYITKASENSQRFVGNINNPLLS